MRIVGSLLRATFTLGAMGAFFFFIHWLYHDHSVEFGDGLTVGILMTGALIFAVYHLNGNRL